MVFESSGNIDRCYKIRLALVRVYNDESTSEQLISNKGKENYKANTFGILIQMNHRSNQTK